MKKIIWIFLAGMFAFTNLRAQSLITTSIEKITLDENTVVKDSGGRRYTQPEWAQLISTKQYKLRPAVFKEGMGFIIYKGNTADSVKALSRMSAPIAPTTNTVVKDSTGRRYTPAEWRSLMVSGQYVLRPSNRGDSALILTKLSPEQMRTVLTRKPAESLAFKTGDTFNFFSGMDIYGNRFEPESFAGKVVVLNFWLVNGSQRVNEIPELNKLAKEYAANGDVLFLALTASDRKAIRDYIKATPFSYHLIEDSRDIINSYHITSYPTDVIIDKQGKIIFHSRGFGPFNINYMRKMIEESI